MTLSTYVPQVGYNQTEAATVASRICCTTSPSFSSSSKTCCIPSPTPQRTTTPSWSASSSCCRSQAALTSSFEDLLTNETQTGWDTEYTAENRTALLRSYEHMLYDEAFLFASFNMKIEDSWDSLCNYTAPGHTHPAWWKVNGKSGNIPTSA